MDQGERPRMLPTDPAAAVHDAAEPLALLWSRAYAGMTHRVSPSQLRALLMVRAHGRVNLTGLAEELGALLPATSRLCDRLVAAGLLERAPSSHDRREIALSLTRDAERLLEQLAARRQADIAAVLARMPPAARRALLTGLEHFARAAGTADDAATDRRSAR